MADAIVSRLGQVNQANDELALFLKIFGGEVLTVFDEKNTFLDKHYVRTISNGKSAQFPVVGNADSAYHTPGVQILGGAVNHGEKVIAVDKLLICPLFIADIDEAMDHADVSSKYATKMGVSLSNKFSRNVAAVTVLASRATGAVTEQPGGTLIKDTTMKTDVAVLKAAFFSAAQALAEKDVDIEGEDVFGYLKPAEYFLLAASTDVTNRDYGYTGSQEKASVPMIAGINLLMTNQIPTTDLSADATVSPSAQGDFSDTVGIISTAEAVGTVKLLDLQMQSEYQVSRQGTLLVGRYAVGHGILRPECAVELSKAV